jgi:flagellar protein FlgJ
MTMALLDARTLTPSASDLAADSRSLDGLKRSAQRDPRGAVKQAAQQFEALFMQMVLKSMRDATPKSGLLDSPAGDTYTGMLDQQMAARMSSSGTGLADVIVRQLTRHIDRGADKGAAAGSAADPAGAAPAAVSAAPAGGARARALAAYDSAARTAPLSSADPVRERLAAPPLAGSSSPQRNFVTRHWDAAQAAQQATGIPAQFVLSQAALESGWGKAEIRSADGLPSYNLFGIKATGGWQGRTVDVVTTEYENGTPRKVVEKFRAYNNYSEAFRDWAQLLAANPRYAGVLAQGRDAAGFAHGLQRAGYATDPAYGDKLTRVIASVGAALRS